jgi:hypothetical protein
MRSKLYNFVGKAQSKIRGPNELFCDWLKDEWFLFRYILDFDIYLIFALEDTLMTLKKSS